MAAGGGAGSAPPLAPLSAACLRCIVWPPPMFVCATPAPLLPLPTLDLPRCTLAAQVNKAVDRAFSSKTPEEPVEPAFVTEAKLRWNVRGWCPSYECRGCMQAWKQALELPPCLPSATQPPQTLNPSHPRITPCS